MQSAMAVVVAALITGALAAGLYWVTEVGGSERRLAAVETPSAVAPPSRQGPRVPEVGGPLRSDSRVGGAISRVADRATPYI